MAFKDSKALHRGMLIGTIVLSVIMFGMHLAGALGRAVVPDLTVSDKVIPTLMLEVLPPIVAGIFLAAPMFTIMSTVDATTDSILFNLCERLISWVSKT